MLCLCCRSRGNIHSTSPFVFSYCKQSKPGGRNSLETRLQSLYLEGLGMRLGRPGNETCIYTLRLTLSLFIVYSWYSASMPFTYVCIKFHYLHLALTQLTQLQFWPLKQKNTWAKLLEVCNEYPIMTAHPPTYNLQNVLAGKLWIDFVWFWLVCALSRCIVKYTEVHSWIYIRVNTITEWHSNSYLWGIYKVFHFITASLWH